MMDKVGKIELERPAGRQTNDLPHGVQVDRLAVRREPHDLVFVAVVRKTEVLSQTLVEDAERMGEVHTSLCE